MARKYNEYEKEANSLRLRLERYCKYHDGDMFNYFKEGSIYGETAEGDMSVGFGIIGSANLLIGKDCAKCGGYSSKEFSPMLKKALADFRSLLENC